ncbi:MAG TPA: Fe-S cluster assembly protein SufD, partial [Vicinamibacteria bacterium]|nr:Fe-S cluster assembly protein SufD [Vicinamibacteria bacterium]
DGATPGAADARMVHALTLGAEAAAELVFVDGRYAPELSRTAADDVVVSSLAEALERAPATVEPHLFRIAGADNVFGDLNAALATDGAVVVVPERSVVGLPIHLLYLSTGNGTGPARMAHVRTLVLAGRGSQSSLVQTWAGAEGARYLTTAATEVLLEEGAIVDHYRLQQESVAAFHVSSLHARQGRGSRFTDHGLLLGAALSRNDATVILDGEGAECALDGLFLAGGAQHVDAHTVIDHARPHCTSRELYNGVLDGKARGVFHGRIVVRPDAQKTSAHQANHNLLLSREALVNSTPALEIHADDVRCKHGSTTGQLDPQSLFYLRSRGIGEELARAMLVYAFAADVIGRVGAPAVRARLQSLLAGRLAGAPGEALS